MSITLAHDAAGDLIGLLSSIPILLATILIPIIVVPGDPRTSTPAGIVEITAEVLLLLLAVFAHGFYFAIDADKPKPLGQLWRVGSLLIVGVALIFLRSWTYDSASERARNWPGRVEFVTGAGLLIYAASITISYFVLFVRTRRFFRSNLEHALIADWLYVHHLVTAHSARWGEAEIDARLARTIEIVARLLRKQLPRRLGASRDSRAATRNYAYAAATEARGQASLLGTSGGRSAMRRFAVQSVQKLVSTNLRELPSAEGVPKAPLDMRAQIVTGSRKLVAASLPIALVVVGHQLKFLTAGVAVGAGYMASALWLAVYLASWLDPDFEATARKIGTLRGVIKPEHGGDQ